MKIERIEKDNLNSSVSITLSKEDYEPTFLDELKKYRNKASMKGFRKGKTPMNFIKKMYGQSVLAEVVMDKINKSLSEYIAEEKLDILGQPLPGEEQERYEFDPNALKDMTFVFDLGVAPEFEIQGLEDPVNLYDVEIPDETVREELDIARKRLGKQVDIEDNIEENDLLTIKAVELEDGSIKEGGWETDFTVLVNLINDEDVKSALLKGKKGSEFDFDINTIEKDKDEAYVRKYLLNLDDDEEKEIGNMFRGTVDKVQRVEAAELNADFFKGYFGNEDVDNEEDAKGKIKEEIVKYYKQQAKLVMNRELMEYLMENNKIDTPDNFLMRWLATNNEKLSKEEIEKDFDSFKKNLQWTLIKNKLSAKYEIQVDPEEIRNEMRNKVLSYMQGYPMDENTLNDMTNRLLSNQEQVNRVYEEVQAAKIFDKLEDDLNFNEVKITLEDFKEVVKELNESQNN
ncbi:MAG: trigger factor [Saprospiraceae bacterium]|nr:trigger factor [Saprospiraceae bacterium]